ncbi:hypothetical protein IFM58399_09958 [Aspergillus lentulus]|nr:uncharacterized protein IFM58399_09958 [Aspergillus lentulus]KAF4158086.1 hypothetical protein CNMCM6069_004741 [Aspergillus lentulus]GFF54970.1 hypothetical protein IFM58399_09958 [Aspergillus lentulus]GFF69803.1 hypothetical protein IFM62136_07678 [Aspergillus lentulus]GFF71043.1 hypothetical protein IFM47457_02795 [Aspergillus lentulus]GFG06801.1 hypothetical protein IFM61392_04531 [Aspergillus lentulus]
MEGIPEELIRRLEEEIEAGAVYALASYSYAPQGVQEAIAVKTALYAAIDNLAKDMRGDLRRYCMELVSGDSHGHPLLRAMTSWLRNYCRLFGNFGGNMIIKSLINYISAGFYELDDTCMRGTQSTSDFTDYFRYKSGTSEAYGFLSFPEELFPENRYLDKYLAAMPAIIDYLNIANDLLSFYKEETMKDAIHVHAHASANHLSHLESLKWFAERAKKAFQRVQCLLSSDEPLQRAAENFLHGYITFHLASKRYRLTELNIPAALEARSLLLERLSSIRDDPDCDHHKAEPVQHSRLD